MKHLILSILLAGSTMLHAQQKVSYTELLASTSEIAFTDSIRFTECPDDYTAIDSNTIKELFRPLYHTKVKSWVCDLSWSLAGKITSYNNYDLLLLVEKNEGKDSLCFNTLHLVTMSKEGGYIASFALYINRNTKSSSYCTSSMLYKDLSIIQNTKVFASFKKFGGSNAYKINEEGLFVYYAKN
jgi:hypothetical protein